jgi:hypothetical protein
MIISIGKERVMRTTISIAMRIARVITGLLAALIIVPGLSRAQGVNRVTGLITDSSGAALVGASIQAKELSTNAALSGTSNDRGYYLLQLPIGVYTITVSHPGFNNSVREKVPVDVGADVHIDFVLPIASEHQSVEVVAQGAAMLTPDSSQVTTTVNNDLVLDSPVALASRERNCLPPISRPELRRK